MDCQALVDTYDETIKLQPIGFISTGFIRKRAVPRQPNVNLSSQGKITLFNHVFTNPEHSLEGLDGFSHMWILFHFHKNESNHIRAKVAPPRLNGARIGVFGTRSPHRPCPIGLSLVHIDKIDGSSIFFSGVDMVDGTPVLDLKPYIPHYDNPSDLTVDTEGMERLELDGQESEEEGGSASAPLPIVGLRPPLPPSDVIEREAPDGEEEQLQAAIRTHSPLPSSAHVRVPEWISQSPMSQLQVTFTPQVQGNLDSISEREGNISRIITDILREDPRSVYLRDRYANQFYTFLINGHHVSCKFDDNSRTVKVFRVVSAGTMCECGVEQWQCSIHGEPVDT
ncbi:tRNA (adenine(37)-N6)-methyltransferase isoform X2 [Macrosteles quadrilineatus]|nr:tRNA (adenine(37)-N6)-methyltransferase isoform X2 [Macrosteles quadrilineatus]